MEEEIDWRRVFLAYVDIVGEEEGVDFLPWATHRGGEYGQRDDAAWTALAGVFGGLAAVRAVRQALLDAMPPFRPPSVNSPQWRVGFVCPDGHERTIQLGDYLVPSGGRFGPWAPACPTCCKPMARVEPLPAPV